MPIHIGFNNMNNIGLIDWVFLFVLVFFIIKVTVRGFIAEFFSKAAVILGLIVAVIFYKLLTPFIVEKFEIKALSALISFLSLFLITYLVIKLVEVLLGSLFSHPTLKSLDRALGFFLGLIEGVLVISVLLIIINIQPLFAPKKILSNSIVAKIFSPVILTINSELFVL